MGGAFALLGSWFALKLQTQKEARGVAAAIVAELSVAQRLLERDGVLDFYKQMLDDWKTTGEVADRQILIDMFDNQPQDVLPVYFSMAGNLGLLPPQLSSAVVEYHALVIGLTRTVVRFLGRRDLDRSAVQALARSVEGQFDDVNSMRKSLIADLNAYVSQQRAPKRTKLLR